MAKPAQVVNNWNGIAIGVSVVVIAIGIVYFWRNRSAAGAGDAKSDPEFTPIGESVDNPAREDIDTNPNYSSSKAISLEQAADSDSLKHHDNIYNDHENGNAASIGGEDYNDNTD